MFWLVISVFSVIEKGWKCEQFLKWAIENQSNKLVKVINKSKCIRNLFVRMLLLYNTSVFIVRFYNYIEIYYREHYFLEPYVRRFLSSAWLWPRSIILQLFLLAVDKVTLPAFVTSIVLETARLQLLFTSAELTKKQNCRSHTSAKRSDHF